MAIPSSLPFSSGITSPIAFAAPVEAGMMSERGGANPPQVDLPLAGDRDLVLELLLGRVRVDRRHEPGLDPEAVHAGPLPSAPTEFVVHDAFEMMLCCSASYLSSFTPRTSVTSGSVAGAEMTTFFAPAVEVLGRALAVGEEAGRLDDDVHPSFPPRERGRIALRQHLERRCRRP